MPFRKQGIKKSAIQANSITRYFRNSEILKWYKSTSKIVIKVVYHASL